MFAFRIFDRMFQHMDLLGRMMNTVGATEKIRSLPSAAHTLRRATTRCLHCGSVSECQSFLDSHESASEAPAYCRNHDLFERLKRDIESEKPTAIV